MNRMIKLMIFDDEPIILEGLQKILDWEQMGYKILGTASDGEEGLQQILTHEPDVVITDIRMNFMDGLEMIRAVRKSELKTEFVVISAYNDFEYAKESCNLAAFTYLLKPIVALELKEVMEKMKIKILKLELSEKHLTKINQLIREDNSLLVDRLLQRVFQGQITAEEIDKKADLMNLPFSIEQYYCVFTIKLNQSKERKLDALLGYAAKKMTEEIMREYGYCLITSLSESQLNILFWMERGISDHQSSLIEMINRLKVKFKEYLRLRVFITKGNPYKGYIGIKDSFLESGKLMERALILSDDFFIDKDRGELKTNTEDYKYPIEKEKAILEALRLQDEVLLQQELKLFLSHLKAGVTSYLYVTTILHQLMTAMLREMLDKGYEYSTVDGTVYNFMNEIHQKSTHEILEHILSICQDFFKSKVFSGQVHTIKIIRSAILFISSHLSEIDLTVKHVADAVYLNAAYFGQIFKKEVGQTFNEYVTEQRIKEAKRLLDLPEFKVYEIAEKVGFKNPQYFNMVFKKITGITPIEYRNNK